jgi:pimeloyl-ACP methyl ester carboxylesterase
MRPQFGVIIGIVVAGQALAQRQLLQGYEPPGKLVDVGRRKRDIHCSGNGSPTIILMAAGGAFSIDWTLVQPRVAEKTRVCSYDRAGLAWSDPGPSDETVEQTIGDLHALLMAAGEKEPYQLVGASVGGIFIRAYQRAFPDEVGGLVFTNSSNRVGMRVNDRVGLIWDLTEDGDKVHIPAVLVR